MAFGSLTRALTHLASPRRPAAAHCLYRHISYEAADQVMTPAEQDALECRPWRQRTGRCAPACPAWRSSCAMRALELSGPRPPATASPPPPHLQTLQQLPLLALAARQQAPPSTWSLRCTQHSSYAGVVKWSVQGWLQPSLRECWRGHLASTICK